VFVLADLDSFAVRYDTFFASHFDTVAIERLPTWLELDAASLSYGDHVLTRVPVVQDNEEEILKKLRALVSMQDEIGMTQFHPDPEFPSDFFVLGHRDGSLTLVPYDAMGVKDPLWGPQIVTYLKDRGAFLSGEKDRETLIIVTRGNMEEVDLWYPRMAREVLHTHTIPGNINPTGYLEFFEGSDRDLIMNSYRIQDPIRRRLLFQENSQSPTR
jgi:hypothetical protein